MIVVVVAGYLVQRGRHSNLLVRRIGRASLIHSGSPCSSIFWPAKGETYYFVLIVISDARVASAAGRSNAILWLKKEEGAA